MREVRSVEVDDAMERGDGGGNRLNGVGHISALVLCRGPRCIGKTEELDPDCPRCGGIDGEHWGTDPVSLVGCADEHDHGEAPAPNSRQK